MISENVVKWLTFPILILNLFFYSSSTLALNAIEKKEFPLTDFSNHSINFMEVQSYGLKRKSIPSINKPLFKTANAITNIGKNEPVISIEINGDARAYPLRVLIWHELVNDIVGGVPILVSFCSLCNSGVVYNRQLGEEILEFENTGRLRHFNTVMFDQNTESWWQQFSGTAIIGSYTGNKLNTIFSRREAFSLFRNRSNNGKVLIPKNPKARPYGTTPFVRMDSIDKLDSKYSFKLPSGVTPMEKVIIVGNEAWPLSLIAKKKLLKKDTLIISWSSGQNSIYDTRWIPFGKDIGNVIVKKYRKETWVDTAHDISFAFIFSAFKPNGVWNLK